MQFSTRVHLEYIINATYNMEFLLYTLLYRHYQEHILN